MLKGLEKVRHLWGDPKSLLSIIPPLRDPGCARMAEAEHTENRTLVIYGLPYCTAHTVPSNPQHDLVTAWERQRGARGGDSSKDLGHCHRQRL